MENVIAYVNEQIYEESIIILKALTEHRKKYSLDNPRLNPVFGKFSLNKKTPEKKLYIALAGLIVTSTHPFSITNQDCLEKVLSEYEKIIPLIRDKEVKRLAEHHFSSTKYNLKSLESISRSGRLRRGGIGSNLKV